MDSVDRNAEDGQLVIPLEGRSFGDFIVGLLGQRRSIERTFSDYRFYIDMNWLLDLDQVVGQRVAQNESSLVAFSARVFFDDGRITTITSRSAFNAYRDLSVRIASGIEIRWTYLIKCPGQAIPEGKKFGYNCSNF